MPSDRSEKREVSERILDAATRLFAERGFEATSLQSVADAVGIRKPSLLYHFPSKDELRKAVLDKLLSHWNQVLPKLLMAATSGREQFDAIIKETVAFFTADRDRARLLLREALDRPKEMRALIIGHVQPWADVVSNYIRRGREAGRVRADVDPEAYIVHAINLVVSSIATFDSIGALGTSKDRSADDTHLRRHVDELVRVARASLFRQLEALGIAPRDEHEEGSSALDGPQTPTGS
jgi:AcrR family transcriptional regulator